MMHFKNNKTKRIVSGVIVAVLVIAMVLPILYSVIGIF